MQVYVLTSTESFCDLIVGASRLTLYYKNVFSTNQIFRVMGYDKNNVEVFLPMTNYSPIHTDNLT